MLQKIIDGLTQHASFHGNNVNAEQFPEDSKNHITSVGSNVGGIGPQLELEDVKDSLQKLFTFLKGSLEVHDKVFLQSSGEINLNLSLQGDQIVVKITDPPILLDLKFILNIRRRILGATITLDKIVVQINNFPDAEFEVKS